MGVNAQTTVPAFTAGAVLTASQQTQINTGIPVFATTTTRDAAFGTGKKTLAQGQYAYIEATSTLQVYTGTAWLTVTPAFATTQTQATQSTSSASYTDLATVTSVTVTTGASALCVWHCTTLNATSNAGIFVSIAVSGATTVAATDTIANYYQSPSSSLGLYVPYASGHIFTGLTPGSNTFTMKFRTNAGTAFFDNRGIQVVTL